MNTTIRQFLDSMGGTDRVVNRAGDVLDFEVEVNFTSTPGTGTLQVSCSGRAIVTFTPKGYRRQMFLVVDESAGLKWDVDERPVTQKGPKPHDVLTLVQSA